MASITSIAMAKPRYKGQYYVHLCKDTDTYEVMRGYQADGQLHWASVDVVVGSVAMAVATTFVSCMQYLAAVAEPESELMACGNLPDYMFLQYAANLAGIQAEEVLHASTEDQRNELITMIGVSAVQACLAISNQLPCQIYQHLANAGVEPAFEDDSSERDRQSEIMAIICIISQTASAPYPRVIREYRNGSCSVTEYSKLMAEWIAVSPLCVLPQLMALSIGVAAELQRQLDGMQLTPEGLIVSAFAGYPALTSHHHIKCVIQTLSGHSGSVSSMGQFNNPVLH